MGIRRNRSLAVLRKRRPFGHFAVLIVLAWFFPSLLLAGGFISPGDLSSDHVDLEGITRCTVCHAPFGASVDAGRCIDCHTEIQQQIEAKHGFHARRTTRCERCHSDHKGREFELVQFDEDRFRHSSTGFALEGEHAGIECTDCHVDKDSWQGLDKACDSCHGDEDPHGTEMSERSLLQQCDSCHQPVDWSALPILQSLFDHTSEKDVDYVLTGKHKDVKCEDCHGDWRFVPTEYAACLDCHDDPHRTSFEQVCEDCHESPASWHVSSFDHDRTPFPLEGLHQEASCRSCHAGHATRSLAFKRCEDCHETPHGNQFEARDCDTCHSLVHTDFEIPEFDHSTTDYPLTGAHSSVDCERCHEKASPTVYADLPARQCDDCHRDIHEGHFVDQECSDCHETDAWSVENFDHSLSAFALEGKHVDTPCVECHGNVNEQYSPEYPESDLFSILASFQLEFESCSNCHDEQSPHDRTVADDTCEDCHTAQTWEVESYDHGDKFSIAPAHENAACASCHEPKLSHFTEVDGNCDSCHTKDLIPGHYKEPDCGACHKSEHWLPSSLGDFDHGVTGFSLLASHGRLECGDCHGTDAMFGLVSPNCAGCHADEDIHRNLLGDQCDECHTPTRWSRSIWRHNRVGWALRGAHKLAACEDCHATGYAGTPTECWRCHQNEPRSSSPAHSSSFGQECDACHRPYNWSATINFSQ
jgi:hypothetical protein